MTIPEQTTVVQQNVNQVPDFTREIKELQSEVKDLHEKLNDKVHIQQFDDEINALKGLIAGIGSGKPVEIKQGPEISTKDIQKWNAAADKVGLHDKALQNLLKELEDMNIPEIRIMITEIQKQLSKYVTIEVFNVTKENVRKNAADISDLAEEISALKRAMEKMQRELDKVAGVTPAELTLLRNRMDKAESEIVNMKRAIQDLQAKIRELMKNAGK